MKKTVAVCFLLLAAFVTMAQVSVTSTGNPAMQTTLVQSTPESTILQYTFNSFVLRETTTKQGVFHTLDLQGTVPVLESGVPEVRIGAKSLIIPDEGVMQVEVLSSDYQEFTGIKLIPSRGNLYRDTDPKEVLYVKGAVYQKDKFYPGEVAALREPYILRDFRGQTVLVQPFQYNPVTEVLRVYHNITVKVTKQGPGGVNTLTRAALPKVLDEDFVQLYNRHFMNYGIYGVTYTPVSENGKMLVISHSAFMPAMGEFVKWKNQKGIPCQMVDVATIGTTAAAIKTYVTNYYNTNGLTYLLLVGDAAQIPTNLLGASHSDNAYAYITGNDHYPEFFVGRFSAENVQHVQTQVLRTLTYEINPDTVGGWFKKAIGIASEEGPGDDNEYDWQHVRNMLTDLMGFTYTGNVEYYEGSQGGNDAAGNPTAANVQTGVDAGGSVILYTGHGSNTSWGTSGFSNTNVAALSNTGKWPFVWAVACVNGNFVSTTCFAEAWLRATKNDQPVGAVAYFGSTINQSWDPPMEGQDEMVDILKEGYPSNIKRTFGGLSISGCMKMNDTYASAGDEMTDTWTIFGDPSLQVTTTSPLPITASHQPAIMIGTTQFPIFCPVNGARATLSHNGQILASGIVGGSTVTLNIVTPLTPDTLDLVITAFNKIPYIAKVPLIVANAPFVTYKTHLVNDGTGNNNQQADFGETVGLNVSLENIGVLPAGQVTAVLSSLNPYIQVTGNTATFGNIPNGSVQQILNAFTIKISDSVPNNYQAAMQMVISDNASNQWTSSFSLTCYAPVLVFDTLYFDDVAGGNGNGKFEKGEVVIIRARLKNIGGAEASQHQCAVTAGSAYTPLSGPSQIQLQKIVLNTPENVQFYTRMDTATPVGTNFQFNLVFSAGYYKANASLADVINFGNEDFETGNFQKFNWQHAGSGNWTVTSNLPYEGTWCARSGAIGNSAQSDLSISWYAAYPDTISFWRKVSCEAGAGQKYDNLEFFIDGVSKGWWDGTKAWARVAYPVTAGQHTFLWRYQKDVYSVAGSDAAWIDLITFPAAGNTVIPKPFMLMEEVKISDVNGNNNGYINAGETIDLSYKITNLGYAPVNSVTGTLTSSDPLVTLTDPTEPFGNFAAGASLVTGNVMKVQIAPTATSGSKITLQHTLSDGSTQSWIYPVYLIIDAPVGIDQVAATEKLLLWPNPFHDQFTVRIPESAGSSLLQVFTTDGRLVYQKDIQPVDSGKSITVPVVNLPAGMLLVRIGSSTGVFTGKILKY
ncbi:MAG TPA: C25 family cysteine peptidase [Bacteroidales bacterium]|nr:C25 family cysteine peptidase [Bacteroidales bacterium]HRZ50295.1 C25 family cysteine peptidase [Bacteroidales bacterium]